MADKNRFSKPVAFNSNNVNDASILKFVSRKNFSGYVKKLILADMQNKASIAPVEAVSPKNEQTPIEQPKQPITASQRLEELKRTNKPLSFINQRRN